MLCVIFVCHSSPASIEQLLVFGFASEERQYLLSDRLQQLPWGDVSDFPWQQVAEAWASDFGTDGSCMPFTQLHNNSFLPLLK